MYQKFQPIAETIAAPHVELPETLTEIPQAQAETYTSKELALKLGTTDRTIRNYIARLKDVYYWIPDQEIQTNGKYTSYCLQLISDIKSALDNGISYQEYKQSVWKLQGKSKDTAITVIDVNVSKIDKADNAVTTAQSTITHEVGKFNKLRQMMRKQLEIQGNLDGSEDGQIYVENYMSGLNKAINNLQKLGE